MCYSKPTFKGASPVIKETLQILLLRSHWWNKNETNMDMNFEQTLSTSQYYYVKAYGTLVVPIILKRWVRPLTRKFLDFSHRVTVLYKYVITILVSTDFAQWLPLTVLSRIPYAFGFAACHVAPSSSGTIRDAHICCW